MCIRDRSGDIEVTFCVFYRPVGKLLNCHILVSKIVFSNFVIEIKDLVEIYQGFSSETSRMAKSPFSGWSVKYTILAGGKKIDPMLLNLLLSRPFMQNLSSKYWSEKKLEGVLFWGVAKNDDVIRWRWRHQWGWNFVSRCQFIFGAHCENFMKKYKVYQKLSKIFEIKKKCAKVKHEFMG